MFSAIVGAFIIGGLNNLQRDLGTSSVDLLAQISQQLAAFTNPISVTRDSEFPFSLSRRSPFPCTNICVVFLVTLLALLQLGLSLLHYHPTDPRPKTSAVYRYPACEGERNHVTHVHVEGHPFGAILGGLHCMYPHVSSHSTRILCCILPSPSSPTSPPRA
jgi:hypothetical protein